MRRQQGSKDIGLTATCTALEQHNNADRNENKVSRSGDQDKESRIISVRRSTAVTIVRALIVNFRVERAY